MRLMKVPVVADILQVAVDWKHDQFHSLPPSQCLFAYHQMINPRFLIYFFGNAQ